MKAKNTNYIIVSSLFLFLAACSTKKDNFATRNWQALNTKYNVLFNGNEALDKGVLKLKNQYNDNFWEILPIERQLPMPEKKDGEITEIKNSDFDLAEEKGVKAVQKRSIYIDGTERNYQIDESYLLLGKARYYENRFIPAMEAFNYILYKYPTSSNIQEAKIWREKTNIRLDNDEFAIKNLKALLAEMKDKNQIYADANAILAQAYVKIEQKDSAIYRLEKALEFTKSNEEKARYRFIIGQLYEELDQKNKAFESYQSVIDMKRKSPKQYVIRAYAKQANQFDVTKNDTVLFLKKFEDLLKDRENRQFLDVLHHQLALYYDKNKNTKEAKKQYNLSLKNKKSDTYLEASNYRNLASIYFYEAKYSLAGKYYDSTLVKLNSKTREYVSIKKKRENLDDVIKYETIANKNDSILNLVQMNEFQKYDYFEKYIAQLKIDDVKAKIAKKHTIEDKKSDSQTDNFSTSPEISNGKKNMMPPKMGQKISEGNMPSDFYFYNAQTVVFGKNEFKKIWGERELKDNWKFNREVSNNDKDNEVTNDSNEITATVNPKYSVDYYLRKIPKKQSDIDELNKDRNFAYYQLGVIYKEKFKEYQLAADKLESLLTKNPEDRLILPSMYNLYKIYEIIDANKALAMKDAIINKFPNSRYAQILNGENGVNSTTESPEMAYSNLYKKYIAGDYRIVFKEVENAVNQYSGDEIVSKIELLKANIVGKINGLDAFKKSLNYVALTYPNTEEGKKAEAFLKKDIVTMEGFQFNLEKATSWKILYKIDNSDSVANKDLLRKITQFSNDRSSSKAIFSVDLYTIDENFVVLHGWRNEEEARGVATILKEYKDYKVAENPIVISNSNYKIVQIKKNLNEYLADPKKVPNPVVGKQIEQKTEDSTNKIEMPSKSNVPNPPKRQQTSETKDIEPSRFGPPEVIENNEQKQK